MGDALEFKPQPKQWDFLASKADIALFGGAAGGGKTYALLLEPLRFRAVKGFACALFRREHTQFHGQGGLWTESESIYPSFGAVATPSKMEWNWTSGAQVRGYHLSLEQDKYSHQGKQYALILFDELTHFSESQFFYLLSRNRSTCGVKPYVRATCNADADSWVAKLVEWWIDPDSGLPIPERAGALRWFARDTDDSLVWGDSMQEVADKVPHLLDRPGVKPEHIIKSFTFIPSKLEDNPELTKKDPAYIGNLMLLDRVERERLLEGNWRIRAQAGEMFQRHWFEIVDFIPPGARQAVRTWDFASTEPNPKNPDPDWTVGLRALALPSSEMLVTDMRRFRKRPKETEERVRHAADEDGRKTEIVLEQESGASGQQAFDHWARDVLPDRTVWASRPTGPKVERARPASAGSEQRRVKLLRGPWTKAFLDELEAFPPPPNKGHDDIVDAFSMAYNHLIANKPKGEPNRLNARLFRKKNDWVD